MTEDVLVQDLIMADSVYEDIMEKLADAVPGTDEYEQLLKQANQVVSIMNAQIDGQQTLSNISAENEQLLIKWEEIRQGDERLELERKDSVRSLASGLFASFVDGLSVGLKGGLVLAMFKAHVKLESQEVILTGGLKDFWKNGLKL